ASSGRWGSCGTSMALIRRRQAAHVADDGLASERVAVGVFPVALGSLGGDLPGVVQDVHRHDPLGGGAVVPGHRVAGVGVVDLVQRRMPRGDVGGSDGALVESRGGGEDLGGFGGAHASISWRSNSAAMARAAWTRLSVVDAFGDARGGMPLSSTRNVSTVTERPSLASRISAAWISPSVHFSALIALITTPLTAGHLHIGSALA